MTRGHDEFNGNEELFGATNLCAQKLWYLGCILFLRKFKFSVCVNLKCIFKFDFFIMLLNEANISIYKDKAYSMTHSLPFWTCDITKTLKNVMRQ